jgi:hypothetical protein
MATDAGGDGENQAPLRSTDDVLRDLDGERAQLVEALDRLKLEGQAARERLPIRRLLAIGAGSLVGLVVARQALRRRRERRLVARIVEAVREETD